VVGLKAKMMATTICSVGNDGLSNLEIGILNFEKSQNGLIEYLRIISCESFSQR